MYKIRCVFGRFKGQYYCGHEEHTPKFDDSGVAVGAEEAASIVMCLIDTVRIVATPECFGGSAMQVASLLANGMFQSPGASFKELIAEKCIRLNADEPIYDQESGVDIGFMSVWEWVARTARSRGVL